MARDAWKWILAGLAASLVLVLALPVLAAVPPLGSFQEVLREKDKIWFFSPAGVRPIVDGETGEQLVELWVRVDTPSRAITDVLQWHYSQKRRSYKALDAYTYDFSGKFVDQ